VGQLRLVGVCPGGSGTAPGRRNGRDPAQRHRPARSAASPTAETLLNHFTSKQQGDVMESFIQLRKGTTPRKIHRDLDGLKDDELGRYGFTGRTAHMYRRNDPTTFRAEGPLQGVDVQTTGLRPTDQATPPSPDVPRTGTAATTPPPPGPKGLCRGWTSRPRGCARPTRTPPPVNRCCCPATTTAESH